MRRTPDIDEPSSVPPHEGASEVTLFKIPAPLPQGDSGRLDGERDLAAERVEFTGGINDFASEEATVDSLNEVHPPAATTYASSTADEALPDELLPATDFVIADEPGVSNLPLDAHTAELHQGPPWAEDDASEEHALDAFLSKPARASAPWRSPDEMLLEAPARRAELDEPVDEPLNASDDTSMSWDAGMIAADSMMSTAATPVPPSRLPWLGMVAGTFLLFAIGMSLLPADGPGAYPAASSKPATRAPAMSSLEPASSSPVERVAGTAGVAPRPEDSRANPEPPPSTTSSAAVDRLAAPDSAPSIPGSLSAADWLARGARQSALSSSRPSSPSSPAGSSAASPPLPKDEPVDATGARPEKAAASTIARGIRSDTPDAVAPPAAPAPRRNNATMPPPTLPAGDTVARSDPPSTPAVPSSETTDRTLPPTTAGEGTAREASPAAPEIPLAGAVEREGTAGEAAAIDGITSTLRRLQLAYEQRNATLVKSVWPTVNERALARAFDGLRSQSVTFDNCWMNVFSASADVECRGVTTYVPRVGGQYQRTESRQWTFRVEKGDNHWLISSAEAR